MGSVVHTHLRAATLAIGNIEGFLAGVRIAGGKNLDEGLMDDFLKQLRRAPPAGLLDRLDDNVMAVLSARRREASGAHRFMALAALISLGGGAFAGLTTREPADAARPLSPFAPGSALVPSALLDSR